MVGIRVQLPMRLSIEICIWSKHPPPPLSFFAWTLTRIGLGFVLVRTCLQISGSGRKVAVNQTLGLFLRRGDLIAYRNGKPLAVLCQGLTGDFVWAAGMYDTGASARIERKPLPTNHVAR